MVRVGVMRLSTCGLVSLGPFATVHSARSRQLPERQDPGVSRIVDKRSACWPGLVQEEFLQHITREGVIRRHSLLTWGLRWVDQSSSTPKKIHATRYANYNNDLAQLQHKQETNSGESRSHRLLQTVGSKIDRSSFKL